MKSKFSSLFARPKILDRANEIIASFSASGKTLFYALAFFILASSISILFLLNNSLQVAVPERGAALSEGIIGSPRFINPVLAITDADRDMTMLIYSGLLKAMPSGELTPDLAESVDISPDNRTYTIHIRNTATFHDGTAVTAEDVAFTIGKTLDPALKSPLRANWQGVQIQIVDPHTIIFTLATAYTPFVNNLTMGILPKHLWQKITTAEFPFSNLNTAPIGSGPFRLGGISRNPAGVATSYELRSFANYALGQPYITNLTVHFYGSENALVAALESGEVEAGSSISPASLPELTDTQVLSVPLNRVFGVFFNQNNNVALQDSAVRRALGSAVDRDTLISQALSGYAEPLTGPIPPALQQKVKSVGTSSEATSSMDRLAAAKTELQHAGWVAGTDGILQKTSGTGKNAKTITLAFSLSTSNVPELRAVAENLVSTWRELGADIDLQVFEASDLAENVIRPRKYDALLFGEIIGRGLDLFAFWDSSQRNDPGLNIALYANSDVDTILAKLRASSDNHERQELYARFAAAIAKDNPAVFLYSPSFIYIVPNDLKGIRIGSIENPSDRFDTVQDWYRREDHVWKIFANSNVTN